MRIGNQHKPIVVAQPRVRPAESTGSLAKAAPNYPVGRVAAFVQKINNGTFGSADTRIATASAKPAAGSPAKTGTSVVRATPSTERIPALPPLKSPALVLALTGVVNRGGEAGTAPAPTQMPVVMPSTSKPYVASLVAGFENEALPRPSQAQEMRAIRDMRETRRSALARPRSTLAATTRLQRIGSRALEGVRKPAPPERYQGVLRADRSEIHLHAVQARAASAVLALSDAKRDNGLSHYEGDWDVLAAFEPFKEPSAREVAGCSVESRDEDECSESDWGDDFDSDFDSDFESNSDDDLAEDAQANVSPGGTPQSLKHLAIAELLKTALETRTAANTSRAVQQAATVEQLKLDVALHRPELEAFDQLPLAARMAGVESLESAVGKTASREQRPAFLDAVESFNRETLRKVGTVAQASASDVERSFGEGFAKMLETHKESLLNHSNTDSGLESDSDAEWGSDA